MCLERLKHESELRQEEEEERAKAVSAAEAARAQCEELRVAASKQAMLHEHAVATEAAARRREHETLSAELSACRRRIEAMVREKAACEAHLAAVQAQLQFSEGIVTEAAEGLADAWGGLLEAPTFSASSSLTTPERAAVSSPADHRASGLAMRSPAWSHGGAWSLESAE